MKRILLAITLSFILIGITEHAFAQSDEKFVFFETKLGNFVIGFFPNDAPQHVENFIKLVESGYYDDTLFHSIISGFMIQGGDPNTIDGNPNTWGQGGPDDTLTAEFNTIKHNRGIVSMARSVDPNSAGSQFFIVHKNSNFLDGAHTVFGRLVTVSSFVTLDKIANHPTDDNDRPLNPDAVRIIKASIISKQDISDMLILSDPKRTEMLGPSASLQKYFHQENSYTFKIPNGWLQESERSFADEFDRFVMEDRPVLDSPVVKRFELPEILPSPQKYLNQEDNYAFKIPEGWLQELEENSADNDVLIIGPQTSFLPPTILVTTTPTNGMSFEEFFDEYVDLIRHLSTTDAYTFISYNEIDVNGKRAYQIDGTVSNDENNPNLVIQFREVTIFEQNNAYSIIYDNAPDDFDTHLDKFNAVLDSFVLLSEPNVSDIVISNTKRTEILETPDGSQKYLNVENNYIFEFPEGWLQAFEGNSADNDVIIGPQTSFHPPTISVGTTQTNAKSFKELLDEYLYILDLFSTSDTINIISHYEIDVHGKRAYQIDGTVSYDENNPNLVVQFREVLIFEQNNAYSIIYENAPDDFDTHLDKFNAVLDSFALLSEQDVSDMLSHYNLDQTKISIGSQKYENVENSYAFESPDGWLVNDFEGWLDADYAQAEISVNEYDVIIVGPETNYFTPLIFVSTEPTNGKTFEQYFIAETIFLNHLSTSDTFNIISHYETDVKGIRAYQIDALIHDENDPNLVLQSRIVTIFTLNNAYSFSYYNSPDIFDIHLDKFNAILDSFVLLSKPDVSDVDLPDVDLPDVDLPDVDLPDVDLPDLNRTEILETPEGTQKYLNLENDYIFEIPERWLVQEFEENSIVGADIKLIGPETTYVAPTISVETEPVIGSSEELFDINTIFFNHLSTSDTVNIISHNKTDVNGKPAYQIDATQLISAGGQTITMQSRNVVISTQYNIYYITYVSTPDDFDTHLDKFNAILDSFALLSELDASDMLILSDLERIEIPISSQKYENIENNYIFEAPMGWIIQESEKTSISPFDVKVIGPHTNLIPPLILVATEPTNGETFKKFIDLKIHDYNTLAESDKFTFILHNKTDVNGMRAYQIDTTLSISAGGQTFIVQGIEVIIFTQNNVHTFSYINSPDDFNTHLDKFNAVLDSFALLSEPEPKGGGGCLIATAAYGSELAPQIQALREIRDGVVLSTESGQSFMSGFNVLYYSFSPQIADWERENPVFKEIVKIFITPMLSTLSILNHVNIDSEQEMITFGVGIILLNLGMYIGIPAVIIYKTHKLVKINLHL